MQKKQKIEFNFNSLFSKLKNPDKILTDNFINLLTLNCYFKILPSSK